MRCFPISRAELDLNYDKKMRDLEKSFKDQEAAISNIFINAVNSHNGEMIMQLARAVWFFKGKRQADFALADRERAVLLMMKSIMEHTGEKLTIRQIAQFLALDDREAGKKLQIPADGFSSLRRKCRQLNIKISPSRKTSRK